MELFDVYSVFPVNIVRGKGCEVYDEKGQAYLDLYGGHAVISVGHSHPYLVKCMSEQLQQLMFYSNSVINKLQERLANELGELSGYPDSRAFFVNSGAEANENALKLASFHTSAAVEVTDNPALHAPINTNHNVYFADLDIKEVETELAKGDVCAVILEGISGVGGVQVPDEDFLRQLRELTRRYGVVLVLDEIQSGYGRTGKFFAHQWAGIKPDLITVAKGIANGFPFSGVLISPIFAARKGMLGTTFGGNHLGCAAALAVLKIIREEKLIENALHTGTYLMQRLQELHSPLIKEIRGRGLMVGVELTVLVKKVRESLLFEERIFTGYSGQYTLRILPPLILSTKEVDIFVGSLKKVLDDVRKKALGQTAVVQE